MSRSNPSPANIQATRDSPATPHPIFNMRSLKFLAFCFFIGFASDVLLRFLGVHAMPQAASAVPSHNPSLEIDVTTSNANLFYKGLHYDNVTGQAFDLYTFDESMTKAAAFDDYWSAYNVTGNVLAKRDWYNCKFPRKNSLLKLGCNTAHGIGGLVSGTGTAAAGGYIASLLKEAFNGKRDNQKPRSVCLARDGQNLCVSWASYNTERATAAEEQDIVKYSMDCARSNGSSEFQTETSSGGALFICVSDRAKGCGANVC